MKVEFYERVFLWLTVATLVVFLGAILGAAFVAHIDVPHAVGQIDPQQLAASPPFDQPGLEQVGDDRYELVMISQIWSFYPNEVRIPVGSTLEIVSTSRDVIHGLRIRGTNVNVMLIPGEISRVAHTFRRAGEYLMVCHEYCGVGHQGMFGRILVEPGPEEAAAAPPGAASAPGAS